LISEDLIPFPLATLINLKHALWYLSITKRVSIGGDWKPVAVILEVNSLVSVLVVLKSISDFRILFWKLSVVTIKPWFVFDWLELRLSNRKDLLRGGIISVKQPKVCVVPDYLVSVIKVSSIVETPVVMHLLVFQIVI